MPQYNKHKNIKLNIKNLYNELKEKFAADNIEEMIKSYFSLTLTDSNLFHEFTIYINKIQNDPEHYQLAQLLIESMTKFKDLPKKQIETKPPQTLINQFAKAFSVEVIRSRNIDITNVYYNLKENLDEGNIENAINSYIFLAYSNSKIFQGVSSYVNTNASLPEHQRTAFLLNDAFNKFKEFAAKQPNIIIPTEVIKRFAKEFSAEFIYSKSSAIYQDIMSEFKDSNLENAFSIYFVLSLTNIKQFQQLNIYIDSIEQTIDDKKLISLLHEATARLENMLIEVRNIEKKEPTQIIYTKLICQIAEEFSLKLDTNIEKSEFKYDIAFQKELETIVLYIKNDEIGKADSFFNDLMKTYDEVEGFVDQILNTLYSMAQLETNDDFTRLKFYELLLNLTSLPPQQFAISDINDLQAENNFIESSNTFFQQHLHLHKEIFSFIQTSSLSREHKGRTINMLQYIFCENEKIYQFMSFAFNQCSKKTISPIELAMLIKELQNNILNFLSNLEPTFSINYPIFNNTTGEYKDQLWPLPLAIRVNNQNIERLNISLATLLSNHKKVQENYTPHISEQTESKKTSQSYHNSTYEMFIDNHYDSLEVLFNLKRFFNEKPKNNNNSQALIEHNRLNLHTQSYINKLFLKKVLAENPKPSFESSNDLFFELEETQKVFEGILTLLPPELSNPASAYYHTAEYKTLLTRMFEQSEIVLQILNNYITHKIVEENTFFTLMKNIISNQQQILIFIQENYPFQELNMPTIDPSSCKIIDNLLSIENIINRNSQIAMRLAERVKTIEEEISHLHNDNFRILGSNMDKIQEYFLTNTNHALLDLLVEKNKEFLKTSNLPRFSLEVNSQLLHLQYFSILNNPLIQSLDYKKYVNNHKEKLEDFLKNVEQNISYIIAHSNQLFEIKHDVPQKNYNIARSITMFEMIENIYTIFASTIDISNLNTKPKFKITPKTHQTLNEMKDVLSNMDIIIKNILKLDCKLFETYSLPNSITTQNFNYKKEELTPKNCALIRRDVSELQTYIQKAKVSITALIETVKNEGNKKIATPKFFESWQNRILEQQTTRLKEVNLSK